MTRERDLFKLPDYKGPLGPAPWSAVVLTGDLERSLREAALRGCASCGGSGFSREKDKVHPCHCINRRQEAAK